MECTAADEWVFSTASAPSDFEVKFLINDAHWSAGENVKIAVGERTVVEPEFHRA